MPWEENDPQRYKLCFRTAHCVDGYKSYAVKVFKKLPFEKELFISKKPI
jgi:hypothetical protein